MTSPNVLFIGPDKTGSTWLAEALDDHPDVFVAAAKDLYYFDRYYDRGRSWYDANFAGGATSSVVAEVCHDYLFSAEACHRIAADLGDVRLLTVLRDPADRAFSSYLHMRKHGAAEMDFATAIDQIPELVDHGRYGTYLGPYVEAFGRDRIWVGSFDDLRADPAAFASGLYRWLGLADHPLDPALLTPRLGASKPRWKMAARLTKSAAVAARDKGAPRLVGQIKRSQLVQRMLYRSYGTDERPVADGAVLDDVARRLASELEGLGDLIGFDVPDAWYRRPPTGA